MVRAEETAEANELPLDSNFVEQAEYLPEDAFLALNAAHPDEESIIRRLSVSGAKLLVGPRGCGKSTLMLKAYYSMLRRPEYSAMPVYVNFKLSLKIEPLYQNTPNASYWFRIWLNLKIYEGLHNSVAASNGTLFLPDGFPTAQEISSLIASIESGQIAATAYADEFSTDGLAGHVSSMLNRNELSRCILLMDDAAHAFSPRQQEDFFEFFRQVKSREISPKAAVYPGITAHSPTFHVGHDAEQIDVWVKPDTSEYVEFMRSLAVKRFGGELPQSLAATSNALEFLAYSSFGIPRSFLNMLRAIYHDGKTTDGSTIDRRRLLDVAKQSREHAHNIYESLEYKLPTYRNFVTAGMDVYQRLISTLKLFNSKRPDNSQASEIGIKRPIPVEITKVLSFLQYAGLVMPVGENSRGEKGVFEIYMIHFGDLITENAMIGRRSKSISSFVSAFATQTHQVWPRISPTALVSLDDMPRKFTLSLPNCQNCGAERSSEQARFCHNCGAQLKTASLYDQLTRQDISVLPLSSKMVSRIKNNSSIRTVRDILIDSDRAMLRSIPFVGPVRAARIAGYAEEHVA